MAEALQCDSCKILTHQAKIGEGCFMCKDGLFDVQKTTVRPGRPPGPDTTATAIIGPSDAESEKPVPITAAANVYLAGRFSRRHELHAIGKKLQGYGYIITSRWTLPDTDHIKPAGMSEQAADAERRRFAMEDLEDIDACDWVVSLMEQPRGDGRGGRHIEFGYGLAKGKKLVIIGPRETVFHHLDNVMHFDTPARFLLWAELK